jgi:hypothetical protein
MSTVSMNITNSAGHQPHRQIHLVDLVWADAIRQVREGSAEIVVSAQDGQAIGHQGVNEISRRYRSVGVCLTVKFDSDPVCSELLNAPTSVLHDSSLNVIRILPPPRVSNVLTTSSFGNDHSSSAVTDVYSDTETSNSSPTSKPAIHESRKTEAVKKAKIAKERISKVPRPPNAFILYRQHHHPSVKAENPSMHNNDICKCSPTIRKKSLTFSSCRARSSMEN